MEPIQTSILYALTQLQTTELWPSSPLIQQEDNEPDHNDVSRTDRSGG